MIKTIAMIIVFLLMAGMGYIGGHADGYYDGAKDICQEDLLVHEGEIYCGNIKMIQETMYNSSKYNFTELMDELVN